MLSIEAVIYIVLGIASCFMGYSLFRSMLPLWGFILGGFVALSLVPLLPIANIEGNLLIQAIVFVVGGLIGALLATPAYFVIIFASGAAAGLIVGVIAGIILEASGSFGISQLERLTRLTFPPQPETGVQLISMVVFAILLGILALNFQHFMIILSSSFIGAAALLRGASEVLQRDFTSQGWVMLGLWLTVGLVGMLVQSQLTGNEV